MKKIYLSALFSLLILNVIFSQKKITSAEQVWLGYINQTRLSDKLGLWVELQLHTKQDFFSNLSETIATAGGTFYINTNIKLTAAYSFVYLYPTDKLRQKEHRPWQQVQWYYNRSRLRLMQWFRLDERFRQKINSDNELTNGYDFNYRFHYNTLMTAAIGKKPFAPNSFAVVLNNELFLNFGKIVDNHFDQNRFFAGMSYYVNAHSNIQFGYLNVFQQSATGNMFKDVNAIRILYLHYLDLRTKRRFTTPRSQDY